MSRILLTVGAAALLATTSCTGYRSAGGQTTVHAECFRLFGIPIPGDDQAAAAKLAGEHIDGQPVTLGSSAADWTSFTGILGNLFGFHGTVMSGPAKGGAGE